jgi:UDP-N-acetylglucosamine:LPS N-acetylglucosamine transferase
VPIEHKDQQQVWNAERIASNGGAVIIREKAFSKDTAAGAIWQFATHPNLLEKMQKRAKIFDANNNAALNIANIVSDLLGGKR